MLEQYFLQDSRGLCDGNLLWWVKGSSGYTADPLEAETFSLEEAQRQHNVRITDIPWPVAYVRGQWSLPESARAFNLQDALNGTGVQLRPRAAKTRRPLRCPQCHCFLAVSHFVAGSCPRCKVDPRP